MIIGTEERKKQSLTILMCAHMSVSPSLSFFSKISSEELLNHLIYSAVLKKSEKECLDISDFARSHKPIGYQMVLVDDELDELLFLFLLIMSISSNAITINCRVHDKFSLFLIVNNRLDSDICSSNT